MTSAQVRSAPTVRIRRPLPALVAAASVVIAYEALKLFALLVAGIFDVLGSGLREPMNELLAPLAQNLHLDWLPLIVVLAILFLCFWGVLPIHSGLHLAQVIVRAVVTSVVTGMVLAIALSIQFLVTLNSPPLANYGPPSLHDGLHSVSLANAEGVQFIVQLAPFILLGAILLWNWGRLHPATTTDTAVPVTV